MLYSAQGFSFESIAVLIYPMSQLWTFMEYVTSGGRGVITQWASREIEIIAADEFHDTLRYLENTPRDLWVRPEYAPFDAEIGEIRFKSNGKPHRVFGFFLMTEKQYVMLIGATKDKNKYNPRDAEKTARRRRREVLDGRSGINEYKYY